MIRTEKIVMSQEEAEQRITQALQAHGVPGVIDSQSIGRHVIYALCDKVAGDGQDMPNIIQVEIEAK